MVNGRKKLLKSIAYATIAIQTLALSPISPESSLLSLFKTKEVQAITNNDGQIPGTILMDYTFKDEDDLKHKIFSDENFIKSYARLADALGFGWCGGTNSQRVGEDFYTVKDGDDYVIKARYNPNDPYAGGYRASERLTMKVSNIKFYVDTKTLVTDQPKVSNLKPMVAGTFNLDNFSDTQNDSFTAKVMYQTSSSKSHQTNYKFSQSIGLKETFKFSGGIAGLATAENSTELSLTLGAEQGWGDTDTTSKSTTLETSYSGSVPAGKRRPIELVALTNEVDVNYKAKIYVDYTITFSGFMRYSDNGLTNHPTDRRWVDYTFGEAGGKSAIEDIWDQFEHRDIPGYSQWDWADLLHKDQNYFRHTVMRTLNRRGGEISGKFHFENATTVNVKALEPIDIPSYHKKTVNDLNDSDNIIKMNGLSNNKISNVDVLDVSTTSSKKGDLPKENVPDNKEPENKPDIKEPENKPDIKEPENKPDIKESENKPNIKEPAKKKSHLIPASEMQATASSQETNHTHNEASNVLDKNNGTIWTTEWDNPNSSPKSITLNLGKEYKIRKLKYLPRQDGNSNGTITKFNIYVSDDGVNFTKVNEGEWENNSNEKIAKFKPVNAKYVKLEAVEGVGGWASASEIEVFGK